MATNGKKRAYDGTSRKLKTQAVRLNIISTYVDMLAERRGGNVLLEEIAERSKISIRTVYRLFNDREALSAATDEYTQSFIVTGARKLKDKTIVEYVREVYKLFDLNENLTLAYVHSTFGKESRAAFRKKYTQLLIAKILEEKNLKMTKALKPKIALIVTLINARLWDDMRNDFGYSGIKTGEIIADAIETLIKEL